MTDIDNALTYLTDFGYLAPGKVGALTAMADQDQTPLRVSLREFQAMAGLQATGDLDDATREAMNRPRCGFRDRGGLAPDPHTRSEQFVQFGTRWTIAVITYAFDNLSPDLDADTQRRVVREAFDQWAAVVPLIFREVGPNDGPDIRIRYARGAHAASPTDPDQAFQGPGGVLAHAFFPPPNAGALAGDVHYDEDEGWQEGLGGAGFDLLTVTVHELGHSLGLRHTSVPNSTMNPMYPTPLPPQADDRAGMRDLYREHIWIASLYRDLLGRRFDDDGLDFWVRQRFGGATESGIARGFSFSAEFSRTLASQLYLTLLDRAPDDDGLLFWTDSLRNGTSLQTVMTGFFESTEYQSKNPGPEAFVTSLYARLLQRAPDPGGFSFWVQQLNSGATPGSVAQGFLFSEEHCRRLVREQYDRFLRRQPDAQGWQHWTDQLKAGLPYQELVAGFLASAEYRANTEIWW